GARHVCVACRQPRPGEEGKSVPSPDGPIFVDAEEISTFAGRLSRQLKPARWPLVRGSLVLLESMELGARGLRLSASVALLGTASAAELASGSAQADAPPVSSRKLAAGAAGAVILAAASYACYRYQLLSGREARIAAAVVAVAALALVLLLKLVQREEGSGAVPRSFGEVAVGATMVLGLALGIGIFFMLPSLLAGAFHRYLPAAWEMNLAEGGIRLLLFFGYLSAISRMANVRRLFQYHGAEHQVIHVHENGLDLTPENAARFPTIHPRCGTAFLAIVLVISVVVFTFVGWQAWWLRLILRLVLLPLVAGVSYELLKWNSRHPNPLLKAVVAPGLWFQRITTQPPSRDQVEVAIAAMDGVLAAERPPQL
ncbi:MAG: DUF1385 domain-containing protein, partial [Chloroflexi bacterium]|nr:DUF1385 domain-containing protein [Chloroflexota bacterium]